ARGESGGASVALQVAYVYGDAEALVAVVLDRLDLALAYRHGLAVAVRGLGLACARALARSVRERVGGDRLQGVQIVGKAGLPHPVPLPPHALISQPPVPRKTHPNP